MRYRPILLLPTLLLLTACGVKPVSVATPIPTTAPTATVAPTPAPTPTPTPTPTPKPTPTPSPTPTPTPSPTPTPTPTPKPVDPSWIDVTTDSTLGTENDLDFVLSAVTVEDATLTLSLLPFPTGDNFTAYMASVDRHPQGALTYDGDHNALVLQLNNTLLQSGDPHTAGGQSDDWVFSYMEDAGYDYPCGCPAGALGTDTAYFEKAALFCDGTDTYLSMVLLEPATHYKTALSFADDNQDFPQLTLQFLPMEATP